MPSLLENRHQASVCFGSDDKEQADSQSPLFTLNWHPQRCHVAAQMPCGRRLYAKIPSSAGVGPWLEPLSRPRPHVLKWMRTSR